MNVKITKLPGSRVEVLGELPKEDFNPFINKVTKIFVEKTEISGFRKGKAPEKMVVDHVGEMRILESAAEEALKSLWPEVLAKNNIEAIGSAEFHLLKLARGNDLAWKAIIAHLPELKLPDWREIAKKINKEKAATPSEATEKEVADTLSYIQKSRTPEGGTPPLLDDSFAKNLGNFSTLEALKNSIREGIGAEKGEKAKEAHRLKIAEEIAKLCSIDIPSVMLDLEREKMMHELRASIEDMGLKWEDYLSHIKKTEEDIKKEWVPDAERRIKTGLVLREIARTEKIEPSEEEITERLNRLLAPYTDDDRKNLDLKRVRDYAYGIVRNDKVFSILELC